MQFRPEERRQRSCNDPGRGDQGNIRFHNFHRHKKKENQYGTGGNTNTVSPNTECEKGSMDRLDPNYDNVSCLHESEAVTLLDIVNPAGAQHNNSEIGVSEQKLDVLNIYGEQLTKFWRDVRFAWMSYIQL